MSGTRWAACLGLWCAMGCAGTPLPAAGEPDAHDHHGHSPAVAANDSASAEKKTQEPAGVVPTQEKAIAQAHHLDGPTKTQGIASVVELASIALGDEFDGMSGQQFRVRELVIEPGGIVAVHQHQQRPGIAYILEGEMVEHRSDHDAPLVRKAGDIAVERTGVSHWWENRSDQPARALVVDILPSP